MSLPPFASIDDYEDRFGSVVDVARAEAAIDDASSDIRAYLDASFVTEDALDFSEARTWAADVFRKVACQVARRRLDNPDGIRRESIDGYETEFTNASADTYLTRSEKAQLNAATGRPSLTVLSTTRGPLETGDVREGWFEGMVEETTPWTLMS